MKLIIEIEKNYYEMIKYNVEHGQEYKPFEILANGTPYEPKGDLISREALKKCAFWTKVNNGVELIDIKVVPLYVIDNAPTVAVNCKDCDGYEAGYSAGLKDAEGPRGDVFPMENVKMTDEELKEFKKSLRSSPVMSEREYFKGICPYTGKECKDWKCSDCPVEERERKWIERKDGADE